MPILTVRCPSPSTIPPPSAEYPIDLSTALRLAEAENPTIAAARPDHRGPGGAARVPGRCSYPRSTRGRTTTSTPATCSDHRAGSSTSRAVALLRRRCQTWRRDDRGAGGQYLGPLTEAWFEPLAAHQRVIRTSFTALATSNEILLDVAVLHLELLANQAILEADRLTESQVYQVAVIVNDFAIAGAGEKADADRAQAEWKLHRAAVRAPRSVAVAAARLANRLNLDPSVRLRPGGDRWCRST